MTLPSLLTFGYWFRLYPLPLVPVFAKILLLVMIAILCIGVGTMLYARLAKGLEKPARLAIRSLGTVVLWAGIVGLYLYAMTWQTVPALGMRVWYIVWFVLFTWLIARAARRLLKDVPAGQEAERARRSYEKWLPKPKK
jgi:hypothetical protein